MAGYSDTPLLKKLGIKSDFKIILKDEPSPYLDWLSPLPKGISMVRKSAKDDVDFVHLFVLNRKDFEKDFKAFKKNLKKDGMMWISWPKKSSKISPNAEKISSALPKPPPNPEPPPCKPACPNWS